MLASILACSFVRSSAYLFVCLLVCLSVYSTLLYSTWLGLAEQLTQRDAGKNKRKCVCAECVDLAKTARAVHSVCFRSPSEAQTGRMQRTSRTCAARTLDMRSSQIENAWNTPPPLGSAVQPSAMIQQFSASVLQRFDGSVIQCFNASVLHHF
ncbi:hypothetical protein GQ42DRAFT_73142 [Ramicandelaber brevisporus]|nr:hypothetical protein GQ42DRAFT_73142 [Ramicandelaber brevisporus]